MDIKGNSLSNLGDFVGLLSLDSDNSMINNNINIGQFFDSNNIKDKNLENNVEFIKNFFLSQENFKANNMKGVNALYIIESHIVYIDKEKEKLNNIEILIDTKKNQFVKEIKKINSKTIKQNDNKYQINVYRINFIPSEIPIKQIIESKDKDNKITKSFEIVITLFQNNTNFISKNIINIEKNNFLGLLKFEDYKYFLIFTYKPPEILELSDFQIVNLFYESLMKEDNVTTENIFSDFIDYSMNLFKQQEKYEFEFFLILYINIINRKNYFLINQIFDLFELNKIIDQKDNSSLLKYHDKLSNYYKFQIYVIEKINHIIKQNISNNKLEFYLIKFYTIYIYFLHIFNLNEKIEEFLIDLRDNNKFDNLILSKLYLSKYSSFYRELPISIEIKKSLINKFFYSSKSFIDLETSFSLISEYLNKNFVNILFVIKENYDKINEICFKNKKAILINNYIKQNDNDNLSKIQECLDFILNKKKENKFEAIYFDINIFLYFINNKSEFEFLSFIESKLFEVLISFKDIEDTLIYSSNLKKKEFIPILEIIIKNID